MVTEKTRFTAVGSSVDLPELEHGVLELWERERSTWTARADALVVGLTRKDGTAALLASGSRLPGVLGSVAALLSVAPLLIFGVLLRALARPLLQRLEAAREALRAIERLLLLVAGVLPLLALTERGRRFIEPLLQLIDAARDVVLRRAQRLLPVAAVDERF